jgi:hypothetical protein
MNKPPRVYRVRSWQDHFETCETRKLKSLDWWPKPNKHDGLGFRRLCNERNRVNLYCAWNLICDVASKGAKDKRGTLERDGKPLTPGDLACMTGFPQDIFEQAFSFFSSPEMAWLECVQIGSESQTHPASTVPVTAADPGGKPDSPATPAASPGITGKPPAEGTEGRKEGKTCTEGNGKAGCVSRLRLRLNQLFNRPQDESWSYLEESQLCEIARRTEPEMELGEIIAFRHAIEPRYFPQSLDRLLTNWSAILDRSRGSGAKPTFKEMEAKIRAKEEEIKRLRFEHAVENPDGSHTWPKESAKEKSDCVRLSREVADMKRQMAKA